MNCILAYFDPGSGSLLLQAIVGGGAGLVVFGKYVWESLRGRQAARPATTPESFEASGDSSGEVPQYMAP